MRIAFLTEMGFEGKVPENHPNMRTEFAWMHALNADHYSVYSSESISKVINYDTIFIIFPKGSVYLNAVGSKLVSEVNPITSLLTTDICSVLRSQGNKKIYYIQEGPHWLWNDYEIPDQINFYNFVASCDGIYAHNKSDIKYYKGMFPHIETKVIPTLMIESLVSNIQPDPQDKVIIGGNFARWYGGFESYMVASEFNIPIWAQTSHAMREHETQMDMLHHLPRLLWIDWMKELSKFKYAIHLMPTVAAGTFSLNCAYFGIPTIGNIEVDTQRLCHPNLSVDVEDVENAKVLARRLLNDIDFYNQCSTIATEQYKQHFSLDKFKTTMNIL
jgi:hypothetical protein